MWKFHILSVHFSISFSIFTGLFNFHQNPVLELSHNPSTHNPSYHFQPILIPTFSVMQLLIYFLIWKITINGIIQVVVLCDCPLLLSLMFLRFYPCCSMYQYFKNFVEGISLHFYLFIMLFLLIHGFMFLWLHLFLYTPFVFFWRFISVKAFKLYNR